jgi:hypothetical protein
MERGIEFHGAQEQLGQKRLQRLPVAFSAR